MSEEQRDELVEMLRQLFEKQLPEMHTRLGAIEKSLGKQSDLFERVDLLEERLEDFTGQEVIARRSKGDLVVRITSGQIESAQKFLKWLRGGLLALAAGAAAHFGVPFLTP